MDKLHANFHAILEALTSNHVRFVVIGGVAMRLQGSAHVTDDVDICYARDDINLAAIVGALAPHHPRLRTVGGDVPFLWDAKTLRFGLNFTLVTDLGVLDILGEAPGVSGFEELWERASVMEVHELSLRISSVKDLLAMKRAAGREKDRNHILELEALEALQNSNRPASDSTILSLSVEHIDELNFR